MTRQLTLALCLTLVLALPALAQQSDTQDKSFDVRSSIGDLHVGKDADAQKAGLPLYPGARPKHEEDADPLNFAILTESFLTTPAGAWALLLLVKGVPAARAQNLESLLKDQFCLDTGVYVFQDHPQNGRVQLQGVVPECSETPGRVVRPAPMQGQHTEEVLLDIGYTKEQIEDFKVRQLVVQAAMPQK